MRRRWLQRAVGCAVTVVVPAAWAQSTGRDEDMLPNNEAGRVRLDVDEEDVLLTAAMPWVLPAMVEDALHKGIPVHFVAEAELLRPRWYWRDEIVLQQQRFMRLSFQPLTRRWRLALSAQPLQDSHSRGALASTFDTLPEAVAVMQRLVRWRLGPRSSLPETGEAVLQLRFRIDLSPFPRPLQIGAFGRSGWNLLVTHKETLNLSELG